ncbi:MAG: dTDP-4-dehydrorhamnose reductase [Betaproteobacteria bacterium]|nr:dTDP-4-dehydrorhamnose reductase [Betaproteobacteria bacterium]
MWGGVECTVNRVRDAYFHQLERCGHHSRISDLDLIAALGVRTLRYPLLWERTAPRGLEEANWSWADARLARLRELCITPIAGLIHHGSGPVHTSLVDPAFPEQLAAYAGAVASRYPWLSAYTPVNEPLTTARFSTLYGHWHPHARDERTFKAAFFNQCRATVLAMREIRRINPAARLIQTEDLGKTYSAPQLAYQADFNNEMRWLSWDLLSGQVHNGHPLWHWLIDYCGATESELAWFRDNPCPPDVLGINHYVTSERVLDKNLAQYPARYHGGNRQERYADVEAARCLATPTAGLRSLLVEAWQRYRSPVAVTEAHIDSTRDDQVRWLFECWNAAVTARAEGADIRAVTAWAMFGAYDWNSLVTEAKDYYESGAFDVRGPAPRPTAIATLIKQLAHGETPAHPVLEGPGWWRRPERLLAQPLILEHAKSSAISEARMTAMRPLLVTGGRGTFGNALGRIAALRGLNVRLLGRGELDIADAGAVERALDRYQPWAVINAAGYVRVDAAETDAERCYRENTLGAETLAAACARHNLPFVTASTDLVFDGEREEPYIEGDSTRPLNVYGKSKAAAEVRVLERHPAALVVRTSAFFGPWDSHNFLTLALRALSSHSAFHAACDITVSPTYVPDLVNACLDLLIDGEAGLWHLSNGEAMTWAQFALRAARMADVDHKNLHACRHEDLRLVAPRPRYSALATARCNVMPSLENALQRYIAEWRTSRSEPATRAA